MRPTTFPATEASNEQKTNAGALTPLTEPGLTALYANLRSYSQHEDNLISQRLTWLLQIQAFLLATYSFTMQKVADDALKNAGHLAPMDFGLLAFGGVLITISIRFTGKVDRAINAAHAALAGLRKIWQAYHRAYVDQTGYEFIPFKAEETNDRWFTPMFGTLPFVHGGGHRDIDKHAKYEEWRDEALKNRPGGKLTLFDRDARYQGYSASANIPSIFTFGWWFTAVIHAVVAAVMIAITFSLFDVPLASPPAEPAAISLQEAPAVPPPALTQPAPTPAAR